MMRMTMMRRCAGTSLLAQALTIALEEDEDRSLVEFYLTGVGSTAGLILFGLWRRCWVAILPVLLARLPFSAFWREALSFIRWPTLVGLAVGVLAVISRFAPSGGDQSWRWVSPGAIAATTLWIIGSAEFSLYVSRFDSYGKTDGSLGAVTLLMRASAWLSPTHELYCLTGAAPASAAI